MLLTVVPHATLAASFLHGVPQAATAVHHPAPAAETENPCAEHGPTQADASRAACCAQGCAAFIPLPPAPALIRLARHETPSPPVAWQGEDHTSEPAERPPKPGLPPDLTH